MVTTKTAEEIKILSGGGKILASILDKVSKKVKPGINTKSLDNLAYELIKKAGGEPAFLNYIPRGESGPYPASLCVSINDEVVHGIPSEKRILNEGDIVSLDLGMKYQNLFTDMAVTVGVGSISEANQDLIDATKVCLYDGIDELKSGAPIGNYGFKVLNIAQSSGYDVVRILVGHGVGYAPHEEPDIPNWGKIGQGMILKDGMVLALEPMVCKGKGDVVIDEDGWTWRTEDGLNSAHFEHTVVIEGDNPRILTK